MKYLLLLLILIPVLPQRARAEGGNAIAAPVATSSGSVTNQAVMVTPTSQFAQTYGRGVNCQGTTFTISSFHTGGLSAPESNYRGDYGFTAQLSIPLERHAVELCKDRARLENKRQMAETDKAELDYHLVRSIKCGEMIKSGTFYHPASSFASVCQDIVALAADGNYRNGVGDLIAEGPKEDKPRPSSEATSSPQSSPEASPPS